MEEGPEIKMGGEPVPRSVVNMAGAPQVKNLSEFEGFLGKALSMEEEQRLAEEAAARRVMGTEE